MHDDLFLLTGLAGISQEVGARVDYVQGGGGNTSVKLDGRRMAIKASGGLLSDVTVENGYSVVDYESIKTYLRAVDDDHDAFAMAIRSKVVETRNVPSIETGFHAVLDLCVIHTHSVYANIVNCAKEGQEIISSLFEDAAWIPYETPGRDLTMAIWMTVERNGIPPILFLQNHGLIVTAASTRECIKIHEQVNQMLRERLRIQMSFGESGIENELSFLKENILFPDQVVFTLSGEALLKTRAAQETIAAYNYIMEGINKAGLTPSFIPVKKAEILHNMESEKFRKSIAK